MEELGDAVVEDLGRKLSDFDTDRDSNRSLRIKTRQHKFTKR